MALDRARIRIRYVILAIAALTAVGASLVIVVRQSDVFKVVEQTTVFNVNDAGIAYIDGDDRVDRWTTNHSSLQWIKLGRNIGRPGNDVHQLGLYNDPAVPGFEPSAEKIPQTRPIRLYTEEADFVVDVRGLPEGRVAEGAFEFPWEVTTKASGPASVVVERCDTRPDCYRASYSAGNGGTVRIRPIPAPSDGFPIGINLAESVRLEDVQIGSLALQPKARRFTYSSKDRHSVALARLGPDGANSFFIGRGGARGRIAEVDPEAQDELFQWNGEVFKDRISEYGIDKQACPGRQAAWVDINNDGLLDLYLVCGRSGGSLIANGSAANKLYIQGADGRFREAAAEYGLDLENAGTFRFNRSVRSGASLFMLWVTGDRISLYVQNGTKFSQAWSVKRKGTEKRQESVRNKVVLFDFRSDGIWDAFVFSRYGNMFFEITEAGPNFYDIRTLGLPEASSEGGLVDLNADGKFDLFTIPQGYFQAGESGFTAQRMIDLSWVDMRAEVRMALLDFDGDGDLDLWLLVRDAGRLGRPMQALYKRAPKALQRVMEMAFGRPALRRYYWRSLLYENSLNTPRPARILLKGPPGNPQAIGATVSVAVGLDADGTIIRRTNLFPGIGENARFSSTFNEIVLSVPAGLEIKEISVQSVDAQAELQ